MIKLKDLLKEDAEEEKKEAVTKAFQHYWEFVFSVMHVLHGINADSYYRSHRREIDIMAAYFVKEYGPTSGGTAWRGIIVDPSRIHNRKINHDPRMNFVSFSEDKQIAISFGDIDNALWGEKEKYPNDKGYLITSTWRPELLLFHWKWAVEDMRDVAEKVFYSSDIPVIEKQKELILKPKPYYYVEPVPPGTSNNIEP